MNLFLKKYIKQNKIGIVLYIITVSILVIVLFLYHLPIVAVGYGMILSIFFAVIAMGIDFLNYRKKQKALMYCKNNITLGMEYLPDPVGLTEEKYQELIKILHKEKEEKLRQTSQQKNQLMEYFTLWTHQIKTPIAAMGLLLEELEDDCECKFELDSQLFKVNQYVDMALQYLRLEGNVSDFIFREYDLDHIIKQVIRKYAPMFIRKKIKLCYEPVNVKVITDEKWLVFVLEQLLSNAIKYTKEGMISIYMKPECDKVLIIEDTGIGIFPEDLPRVFESGYTGYNGRRDKKATGIGLYLCRQILGKLSHEICLESEPGKGTKVILNFLPL